VAGAITLLVNSVKHPVVEYSFTTPREITQLLQDLIDAFRIAPSLNVPPELLELTDPYHEGDLEDDEENVVSMAPDIPDYPGDHNEQHYIADSQDVPLPASPSGPVSNPNKFKVPYQTEIQKPLRRLLVGLYKQLPTKENSGHYYHVFMRYITLASTRLDGNWRPTNQITQEVNAFLFAGRLTLYSDMYEHGQTNNSADIYKCVTVFMSLRCFADLSDNMPVRLSRPLRSISKSLAELYFRRCTCSCEVSQPYALPTKKWSTSTQ
jgi:hypothetical protein